MSREAKSRAQVVQTVVKDCIWEWLFVPKYNQGLQERMSPRTDHESISPSL